MSRLRFSRRAALRIFTAAVGTSVQLALRTAALPLASLHLLARRSRGRAIQTPLTSERVQRAIREGISYLKAQQRPDGSWPNPNVHHQHTVGPTSLVVHALLMAGESPGSPHVVSALKFLENFSPEEIDGSYSVGLQTMVFAEVDPDRYRIRIAANVDWLERAQIKEGDNNPGWPGSWAHTSDKTRRGDNSSTQFALLGLNAAALAGVPVKPEIWRLSWDFLSRSQRSDGGWSYYPNVENSKSTASMTCAGISGLVITGQRLFHDQEVLEGEVIRGCGSGAMVDRSLLRGLNWITARFTVSGNPGSFLYRQWKHYYLYGMERVGRFTGQRYLGGHDWYREGAQELVATQHLLHGYWVGVAVERQEIIATSLALLFLATGRAPVLINKLRHGPDNDWNNDAHDVRNLVAMVSNDWKHLLTWQVVDPTSATVEEMLQAPIAYFNGHEAPVFSDEAKATLRSFIEQGGIILAEACCGDERFDRGFRALVQEIFPEPEFPLHPLDEGHPIWRSHHLLSPEVHPLWGIEYGCRTVLIYSPADLSCFWNQMDAKPSHPRVIKAQRIGLNIVDYATGREPPPDKLVVREVRDFRLESPKRGALHIAKLRHAGDWNVAPRAIPSLTNALQKILGVEVVINHKELLANDPNLAHYPLIYFHGRSAFSFINEDIQSLRRHFSPGGGSLFADAACGSSAFDTSFRSFMATLFPESPLVPIPREDPLYSKQVGYDLSNVQYTQGAGGGRGYPELEGVKVEGHWAVIYSKYDIGCALERATGIGCKGYQHESALKIAINIVIYAMQP